jgi:hypothetical protein
MVNLVPPDPFEPQAHVLGRGHVLFRVFQNTRKVTDFNPGRGKPTRFAPFASPPVGVLYAADTEEAAVCESLLHDVPPGPGTLLYEQAAKRVLAPLEVTRELRLASLMGDGLRVLGTEVEHVTATPASQYHRTVLWAEAAHSAGFDGLAWMSHRCNTDRAYVLFGDRCDGGLDAIPSGGRIFAAGEGFDWLVDYLATVRIEIVNPGA